MESINQQKETKIVLAHVRQDPDGEWREHALDEHLIKVSKRAGEMAQKFCSADWAKIAGLWHDLGKYSAEFQEYIKKASGYDAEAHIEGAPGRVDHSTAGAIHAINSFDKHGRILAYLIAGHHAGLPDWYSSESGGKALSVRLGQPALLSRVLAQKIPSDLLEQEKPSSPVLGDRNGFALWLRMLFSCLVDADFLDTEEFMDKDKSDARRIERTLMQMLPVFDRYMSGKTSSAKPTLVNSIRADVLLQCRIRAALPPGIFSLTVPTGGGKTLSSLAFALEHARYHGKRRIIYAIPYTSIIEQTADIFRDIFKEYPDTIIEHHSNLETKKETAKSRLATENWDAPLIVTTNVQLFESLFSSKTSRCRKLHNLVDSIVVLDEAQLLPPEFLQPILDVLNLLATHYRVTFVLSTATQPALNTTKDSFGRTVRRGLDNVREIIADVDALYTVLDRVKVELPSDLNQPTSWDDLAKELCKHDAVLAIVNTRNDCRELWQRMPRGTIHLSGLMCGQHRSRIIRYIKWRLKKNKPLRVVSTQLVEAGVDLDFPVIYRALAGLDSIAQAAGRCNREGKLEKGKVIVFVPPKPAPKGLLRFGEDATKDVWHNHPKNPLERKQFARYFDLFLSKPNLDEHGIGDLLEVGAGLEVQFRSAAEKFRLIDDSETQAVFVGYNREGKALLNMLCSKGPERWLMRKLQRYSVTLYRHDLNRLLADGDIEEFQPGMYAQVGDTLYHPQIGLLLADTVAIDPASLLV
ncbi:MAG: CRISPR-associated helicase Cas3' [Nitrosomonas sp.]|nr:CRISPR-associated helicase Cas3' [Nitrosomonas sp.]MBP6075442.1 CRISPR-associated helicase Cas3' [Nitrosomonas sp.]